MEDTAVFTVVILNIYLPLTAAAARLVKAAAAAQFFSLDIKFSLTGVEGRGG